ncbi:MAG: peptide-methionine (S)-S-oxide reductase MsrA [Magnetococcales bacterium]|nr:peptide-methionine (S)-S-oxide reductase MsrA [Magnetococcales bacterium]
MYWKTKMVLPAPLDALPGREQSMPIPARHYVTGHSLLPPYPARMEIALFGMGCFWGAERRFWETGAIHVTAAGYAGGFTPNPTYHEVCTGLTGHNEVVQVVFDPRAMSFSTLLRIFWEAHDPTQGMRQGNDLGTQYRSGIYTTTTSQMAKAMSSREIYQSLLTRAGHGPITTEILPAPEFFFAEGYHQQYLAKNPQGYCGLGGTGISYPDPT